MPSFRLSSPSFRASHRLAHGLGERITVVQLAVSVAVVAERIEMGHPAVDVKFLDVAAESRVALRVVRRKRLEADLVERDAVRLAVGLGGLGLGRQRHRTFQRHDRSGLGERHGLLAFLRRDEIQRAELIVLAPSAPVGELGVPAFALRLGDRRALAGRAASPGGGWREQRDAGHRRQAQGGSRQPASCCSWFPHRFALALFVSLVQYNVLVASGVKGTSSSVRPSRILTAHAGSTSSARPIATRSASPSSII